MPQAVCEMQGVAWPPLPLSARSRLLPASHFLPALNTSLPPDVLEELESEEAVLSQQTGLAES